MAAKKAGTKKDLEAKIAELEAKLTKLSSQLEAKPKPSETPKPKEAPKPAETKPAETKPAETKPAETPKPQETPKPTEEAKQPPVTVQAALEDAYMSAPMTDFHQYRAKVTGYTPAPNRYFVRRTAPVGKVPTSDWNLQKSKVTGYTQPSNQYFATRARLAYSPPGKTFGGFSGTNMTVEGVEIQPQTQQAPPTESPPKPKDGTLPKGTAQVQQASANEGKSRQQLLEEYENDYLKRIEDERIAAEQAYQEAVAAEAKRRASSGTLPKGFEAAPEPEAASKQSKGTLPKGF